MKQRLIIATGLLAIVAGCVCAIGVGVETWRAWSKWPGIVQGLIGTSWLCSAWSNFLVYKRYGRIVERYDGWMYIEVGLVVCVVIGIATFLGGWIADGMSWSVAAAWGGGSVIVLLASGIGNAAHQRTRESA